VRERNKEIKRELGNEKKSEGRGRGREGRVIRNRRSEKGEREEEIERVKW
jgi:hypothetical protein